MASQQAFIISTGASQANFVAASSVSSCLGSSLGMEYALESGSNASASLSTRSSRRSCTAAPFSSIRFTSASYWAYFLRPTVRLPTMEHRAVPRAPTRAAAPPPPGTGALEARTAAKSAQLFSIIFSLIDRSTFPGKTLSPSHRAPAQFSHMIRIARRFFGQSS